MEITATAIDKVLTDLASQPDPREHPTNLARYVFQKQFVS